MIGTFWNMCRSCPSVPVDKLHTEYRSTYRWHEYPGPRADIVRRPPTTFSPGQTPEPALPRRKKHPELAYSSHLTLGGSETFVDSRSFPYDRARSEERTWTSFHESDSRRSKSEGRQAGKSSVRLTTSRPINIPKRTSTTFARTRENYCPYDGGKAPLHFSNRANVLQTEVLRTVPPRREEARPIPTRNPSTIANPLNARLDDFSAESSPVKSALMSRASNRDNTHSDEAVPVHRKTAGVTHKSDHSETMKVGKNVDSEDGTSKQDSADGEFKSEYKKNFQPFNSYNYDESKGVFEKRAPIAGYNATETDSPSSSSWYKEVVILRKEANQYRHRGWGTELIPDHIAQVYNDQMLVWEQVSRRSTLSALSLATTVMTRSESPSKADKENRKDSPAKSMRRSRSVKTGAQTVATHQGKPEKKKSPRPAKSQPDLSPRKGKGQVKKLAASKSSPGRTSREPGAAVSPTVHKSVNLNSEKPKRRPRPTSLIARVPSGARAAPTKNPDAKADGAIDDFPQIVHEQIVKSPPEPTRVKSPEQIVTKSPEPVNWTVPLDTGKTFTVTQNIREGELAPRSYSEARAWTSNSAAAALNQQTISVSAPTELADLNKMKIQGEILTK